MRAPKFVKALLLTSALFAALAPAYASAQRDDVALSNTITASFKVTAPVQSLVLNWTNENGEDKGTALDQQTVSSGDEKDIYVMASATGKSYTYALMLTVKHPDPNADVDSGDFTITEVKSDSTLNVLDNKVLDYGKYVISSYSTLASGQNSIQHFKIKFNTAGIYNISVDAVSQPG